MRIFRLTYFLVVMVFLSGLSSIFAASVSVEKGPQGKAELVLKNNLMRLEIDPQRGARVDSFKFKPWGKIEIIQAKRSQGLFVDHFWQESWPGQFWTADYHYRIISRSPGEVSVAFSYLSRNKGVPGVAGILLKKTITLKDNSRVVKVKVSLTNTTPEGKYVGYWLQNIGWLGGNKQGDDYFRPSLRGISKISSDNPSPANGGFVRAPQAGWTAAIDQRTETGLVFLMDYNYLWFLYNCAPASTVEWQYDAVAIPPGKTWQTEISLLPISGMASLSFASKNVLAGIGLKENKLKNTLEITGTFMAAEERIGSLEIKTGIESLLSHKTETAVRPQQLRNLGFEPQKVSFSLPYDTQKGEPLAVKISLQGTTLGGKTFKEHFELWYPGSFGKNRNPTNGFPFYKIPSPAKQKVLLKPKKIVRTYKKHPQVLFLQGLLSDIYKLKTAIKKISPDSRIKGGYAYNGVFGPHLDYFPYDYKTLMSYDLIIVGDISAATIGETGLEMLKDYVRYGGNLLVLGGPFAYGDGGYRGTAMDKILPVRSQGPFDIRPVTGVMKLRPDQQIIKAGPLKVLKVEYLHRVKVKPGSKVLLSYGGYPFLVAGTYGTGKVICLTGTPLGKTDFYNTREWGKVLADIFNYLGLKAREER